MQTTSFAIECMPKERLVSMRPEEALPGFFQQDGERKSPCVIVRCIALSVVRVCKDRVLQQPCVVGQILDVVDHGELTPRPCSPCSPAFCKPPNSRAKKPFDVLVELLCGSDQCKILDLVPTPETPRSPVWSLYALASAFCL